MNIKERYIYIDTSEVTQEMKDNSIIYQISADKSKTILSCDEQNRPSCFDGMDLITEKELYEIYWSDENEGVWYFKPPV